MNSAVNSFEPPASEGGAATHSEPRRGLLAGAVPSMLGLPAGCAGLSAAGQAVRRALHHAPARKHRPRRAAPAAPAAAAGQPPLSVTKRVLREFAALHHELTEVAGVKVNLFQHRWGY